MENWGINKFFDKDDNLCYHQLTGVNIMSTKKKLIGSRIPEPLVLELRSYCKSHGILINHFVSEAIAKKLREEKEYEEDIATIEARKNELTINEEEWKDYLKSREIKV